MNGRTSVSPGRASFTAAKPFVTILLPLPIFFATLDFETYAPLSVHRGVERSVLGNWRPRQLNAGAGYDQAVVPGFDSVGLARVLHGGC